MQDQFNNWNRINTAAGTLVVSGSGRLGSVIVNNFGTAWEIELYDGTSSASTNVIGVIKGGTVPTKIDYNIPFKRGLFVNTEKGTTAGDLTLTY